MRKLSLSVALSLSLLTGCFSVERDLEFSEVDRLEVKFENVEAAQAFHRAMRRVKPYYSEQTIQYLFPLFVRVRWNLHETEFFNSLVRRTDINRDGQITESEASSMLLQINEEAAEEDD